MGMVNYEFHNLSCHSIIRVLLKGNNEDDEDEDEVKQTAKKVNSLVKHVQVEGFLESKSIIVGSNTHRQR